jgi:hypothetical protein
VKSKELIKQRSSGMKSLQTPSNFTLPPKTKVGSSLVSKLVMREAVYTRSSRDVFSVIENADTKENRIDLRSSLFYPGVLQEIENQLFRLFGGTESGISKQTRVNLIAYRF